MLHTFKKYEPLHSVVDRCNDTVLDVLRANHIREAEIAAESFSNGGKRLRPALMILSAMVADPSLSYDAPTALIELAAAVELVHLATLFHDDVIDEVETRRDRLSARAKYGNYVSVLAGDYVLAEALLLVHRTALLPAMPEFLSAIRILVSGESKETVHKFDFDLSEALYYEIISEKSASLFALSCKVGGLSRRSEHTDLLGRFGWNLGMAFQMIDDLDDMLELPIGNGDCDLRNGYLALPVIHVLANLQDGHRDALVEIIRGGDFNADNERQIIAICAEHGGIDHTHAEIHKHLDRAAEMLVCFNDNDAKTLLEAIVGDLKNYTDNQSQSYLKLHRSVFASPGDER